MEYRNIKRGELLINQKKDAEEINNGGGGRGGE